MRYFNMKQTSLSRNGRNMSHLSIESTWTQGSTCTVLWVEAYWANLICGRSPLMMPSHSDARTRCVLCIAVVSSHSDARTRCVLCIAVVPSHCDAILSCVLCIAVLSSHCGAILSCVLCIAIVS